MKKFLMPLWAMSMVLLLVSPASALQNNSFEFPDLAGDPPQSSWGVDSWTVYYSATGLGNVGVWKPPSAKLVPVDGDQVAFVAGTVSEIETGWMYQNTGLTITPGLTYTFGVYVGNGSDLPFLTNYNVSLRYLVDDAQYDITEFRNLSAEEQIIPEEGGWEYVQVGFTALEGEGYIGKELRVVLAARGLAGSQIAWDNASLSPAPAPVPEPATMFLLGSGLIGVGVFVRRKFKR